MNGEASAAAGLQSTLHHVDHGASHDGPQAVPTPPPAQGAAVGTTMEDLQTLLLAVESRLRTTVEDGAPPAALSQVRRSVLECVEALAHMQASLAEERLRYASLQQAVSGLQARLCEALSDLAVTQVDKQRAQHRAMHDDLTSLPNRSYFRQHLDRALHGAAQAAPPLAVLYLDLDGMKAVNDTHGHCVGDQLLIVVASRLVHTLRSTDVVSRLGGDEFALLLAGLPAAGDVSLWATRLCAAISAPVQLGTLRLRVRASIGIAMCPEHGDSAAALLQNADRAMYRAKRQRSGHAFFNSAAAR
jgi:diguanylate cyclase